MEFRLGALECPTCGRMILPEGPAPQHETPASSAVPEPSSAVPVRIDWQRGSVVAPAELLPPPPVDASRPPRPPTAIEDYELLPPPLVRELPADGNTSGLGPGYPLPPAARGWTNAGIIPAGLYSFYTGSVLWGIVGVLGVVFGLAGLVYFVVVGLRGKEYAWRNRRFASFEEFEAVMAAWNNAGLWIIYISAALLAIAGVVLIIFLRRSLASLGLDGSGGLLDAY
jgi:hypothetical protein